MFLLIFVAVVVRAAVLEAAVVDVHASAAARLGSCGANFVFAACLMEVVFGEVVLWLCIPKTDGKTYEAHAVLRSSIWKIESLALGLIGPRPLDDHTPDKKN